MLNAEANASLNERRHGRGPRQGEILYGSKADLPHGQVTMVTDEAKRLGTIKMIERWKHDMPTEAEMLPRDKYSMFDRKAKGYRKGVHSKSYLVNEEEWSSGSIPLWDDALTSCSPAELPKWTRVSQRLNPPGY